MGEDIGAFCSAAKVVKNILRWVGRKYLGTYTKAFIGRYGGEIVKN